MTTTYEDWAHGEYLSDVAEQEQIQEAVSRIPIDKVAWYLGTYGDELERRIELSYSNAETLCFRVVLGLWHRSVS